MAEQHYDIAIVGGGPVGLTMGLALARAMPGITLALIDRRPLSVPRDQRASTIAAGVRRVLDELGVWSRVADGAQPVLRMRITDSGGADISRPLFLSFEGDVAQGEPFAHLVPNTLMAEALLGALEGSLDVVAPAEITGLSLDDRAGRLSLRDGRTIAAQLVIAADGVNSALRQMAGIGVSGHAYGQSGIVTTIGHSLDHEGTAYEHFRPAGPFASLPLPGRRSSLVWTETERRAAEVKGWETADIAAEIEAVMGASLGSVTLDEGVQVYPLRLQIAKSFIGHRLALIGDAAHVVHPIAGQGLNLGLKDVAALAEAVIEAMRLGLDPGSQAVLTRYQQWRRFDTALMAMVTDGMNRLFSNDVAPLRALRDFGLGAVDRLGPLKTALIGQAAGLDRNGPRLLRGLPI